MFLSQATRKTRLFPPVDLQDKILSNCTRSQENPAFLVDFLTDFLHRTPDENAYDDESHLLDIL